MIITVVLQDGTRFVVNNLSNLYKQISITLSKTAIIAGIHSFIQALQIEIT